MTLKIESVPDRLTRSQIRGFLEALGIDPAFFPRNGMIEFTRDAVRFEVIAQGIDGLPFAIGDNMAMHEITIPIVEDD